ncbi:hypothetical protein D3C72_1061850 [compost metagenome]
MRRAADAIERLAALSPEAPAREGVLKAQEIASSAAEAFQRLMVSTKFDRKTRELWAGAYNDMVAIFSALTPRHEAPASHAFEVSHSIQREGGCKVCGHDEASHEAPAEGAGEDSPITAAIRARLAKVKATTYNFGTPAESLKAGEMHGLNTALAIAMVEDERALRARSSAPEAREGEGG